MSQPMLGAFHKLYRTMPITSLVVVWVVLPLVLVLGGALWHLRLSLPTVAGKVHVVGLSEPVTILRDTYGVPTIVARTDEDAFFSLGYLHAQDRLWQMEFRRRIGQGRVSEILGRKGLRTDQYARTLGLYRAAVSAYERLPEPARLSLEAYSRGVNARIAEQHVLPPEFQLFRVAPEPWTPADSILLIKLMALDLSGNYQDELRNQIMVNHLGEEKWRELLTLDEALPSTSLVPELQSAALLRRVTQLHDDLGIGAAGAGSNAWVVDGRHTRSGKPLLASDPHLVGRAPATFYLAELRGAKLSVRGATIPGVPVVIFGHNQHIAWGATNVRADAQDLFIERLHPMDDRLYQVDGEWRRVHTRTERIEVAPNFPAFLREEFEPVAWTVRETRNGPLISDVVGSAEYPVALRWTALDERDDSYSSFLAINYASNWEAFNAALTDYVAPVLTFVYADTQGTIGLRMAGQIPVRSHGHGMVPLPGWDGKYAWQAWLDSGEMPRVERPSTGFIVTANDRIDAGDHFISSNWQPPYRAKRIERLLGQLFARGDKVRATDFVTMQRDQLSLQADDVLPFLTSLQPRNPQQAAMLEQLRAWDRRMVADSAAAAIFHSWLVRFSAAVVADDLAPELVHAERAEALQAETAEIRPLFINRVLAGSAAKWCDDSRTPELETCLDLALLALDESYEELERLLGGDVSEWRWADVHEVVYRHDTFGASAMLARLFDRHAKVSGGPFTIDLSASRFVPGRGYTKVLGAAYRQVIDLGAPSENVFEIDLGQSGNLLSAHYDDWLAPFNDADRRLPGAWQEARDRLLLSPQAAIGDDKGAKR